MKKPFLHVDHLGVSFPGKSGPAEVLADINLTVNKGEFIAIIGHSGCGKSTLLNVIGGLVRASLGCVLLENREVNDPGPDRAIVFQNHSLLKMSAWASTKFFRVRKLQANAMTGLCIIWHWFIWTILHISDRPNYQAA